MRPDTSWEPARPRASSAAVGATPAPIRTVDLDDRRTLVVRPMMVADAAQLRDHFASLPERDRCSRFFTSQVPSDKLVRRWAGMAEEGGLSLAAVVLDGTGPGTFVAEAGYARLDNGNGELALSVSAGWRGWLGPFLLDALVEEAAARGIPNLEADIRLLNRTMLALVRSRGYATIDHDDAGTVRVVIGTKGRVPTWPPQDIRPRVVACARGGRWRAEDAVRAAGFLVLTCPGPLGRPRGRCPALHDNRPCPLASQADVVVMAIRDDELAVDLVAAHHRQHPDVPLVREGDPNGVRDGEVLPRPVAPEELVAELRARLP